MKKEIEVKDSEVIHIVNQLHDYFSREDVDELVAYMAMMSICKILEEKRGFGCKPNHN